MNHLSLAVLGLAVSPLVAQTQFTSPPNYLTAEGPSSGYYFGAYTDGHFQQADGELPAGVQVLTKTSFRPDYRSHTTTAAGRSWTNVSLKLSDGDHATMTSTFSSNILSTPTQVFSGSATFPDVVGNPTSSPAPWNPSFPFTGTYVHSGTKHLLLDWQFSGGTLANAATWTSTSANLYYLDGINVATAVTFGRNVYRYIGTSTTTPCTDSANTSTTAYAQGSLQVGLYHSSYTGTNPPAALVAGKAALQLFASACAPNGLLVRAIGLNGTTPGVSLSPALGCHNLMIDLTQVAFYVRQNTDANGNISNWLYMPIGDLTVLGPYGTVPIWSQAAFSDSITGQTKLTTAERCSPQFNYPLSGAPKRKMVFTSSPTSTTGSISDSGIYNPIALFN
jgi:hypothetical protein